MAHVALLRHGQSRWNLENRFTGWVDVDLTAEGEKQAIRAGQLLAETELPFAAMHTSLLTRAIRTGTLALEAANLCWLPVRKDWRLNERHYGALTGLNKAETAARHGEEQVRIWRRSYDVPPPPLDAGGPISFAEDRRYAGIADLPRTESLKTTLDRVLPCWRDVIAPELAAGRDLIVAAHGNSLRAILKHVFKVSDQAIVEVEIPTGNPLLIGLGPDMRVQSARYLDETRAEPLPQAG